MMLSKVDGALGSSKPSSAAGSKPSSASTSQRGQPVSAMAFAHMSRAQQLQLAKQQAAGANRRIEVPEQIKERFRDEYEADPEAFRKLWEQQTPEFRKLSLEPMPPSKLATSKPPTPKFSEPKVSHEPPTANDEVEAWLRKAQTGKATVKGALAAQSSFRLA